MWPLGAMRPIGSSRHPSGELDTGKLAELLSPPDADHLATGRSRAVEVSRW